MKRIFINGFLAGIALFTVSSVGAQDQKEKSKEKKEVQQIIITRSSDVDTKTVIEINGDKVTVNGKDVKNIKDSDIKVKVNKVRDVTAYRGDGPGDFDFNFNMDHNRAMSLFTEDENRAMLGVVTKENEKGAQISSVSKESAAAKAGLKEDDIITKIDDVKIVSTEDVSKAIRKHKPGEKVTISFLRAGKEQKVTAELGKWKGIKMNNFNPMTSENFRIMAPDMWDRAPGTPPTPFIYGMGGNPKLGLSVQDTEDGKGVKIIEVDEEGNAAKAGLKEGDIITHINDEAVNSADQIARKIRADREKTSVQVKLLRGGKAQTIEVKIPRKLKTADL